MELCQVPRRSRRRRPEALPAAGRATRYRAGYPRGARGLNLLTASALGRRCDRRSSVWQHDLTRYDAPCRKGEPHGFPDTEQIERDRKWSGQHGAAGSIRSTYGVVYEPYETRE